jgi:hypothetical protein
MKPENTLTTSSPAGILNSETKVGAESEIRLPLPLPGSQQMTFTINGEDFTFTITVDTQGNLTAFTATGEGATFNCMIQLVSEVDGSRVCCGPSGCTSGSCL